MGQNCGKSSSSSISSKQIKRFSVENNTWVKQGYCDPMLFNLQCSDYLNARNQQLYTKNWKKQRKSLKKTHEAYPSELYQPQLKENWKQYIRA